MSCVFHPTGFSGECPRSELLHYLGRFLFLPGAGEGWNPGGIGGFNMNVIDDTIQLDMISYMMRYDMRCL